MKPKSNDPLQILLRNAMHQMRGKVSVTLSAKQSLSQSKTVELRQCERPQWTPTRLVALIHRSPQGRETYLGVFQELKSDLFKARRLVPSDKTAHGALPREVVTQDYWLHPQVHTAAADSPEEVRAIEARFADLLKEYG